MYPLDQHGSAPASFALGEGGFCPSVLQSMPGL
jgi:hypothetical protein